jgi:hypothetical protein
MRQDFREGLARYVEKRPARFTGAVRKLPVVSRRFSIELMIVATTNTPATLER